ALATALLGCGGAATTGAMSASALDARDIAAETTVDTVTTDGSSVASAPEDDALVATAIDLSSLPAAPWEDAPIGAREAPAPLLRAWDRAENREWCAPIAPRSLGTAAEGARARAGELE